MVVRAGGRARGNLMVNPARPHARMTTNQLNDSREAATLQERHHATRERADGRAAGLLWGVARVEMTFEVNPIRFRPRPSTGGGRRKGARGGRLVDVGAGGLASVRQTPATRAAGRHHPRRAIRTGLIG